MCLKSKPNIEIEEKTKNSDVNVLARLNTVSEINDPKYVVDRQSEMQKRMADEMEKSESIIQSESKSIIDSECKSDSKSDIEILSPPDPNLELKDHFYRPKTPQVKPV